MKIFMTILSLMVISSSALADNENERISKEMLIVLQSEKVAALFSEVDGAKKFKEIKISLQSYLPDIGVEAEVPRLLVFVLAINITVTNLRIVRCNSQAYVITELFAKEQTQCWFRAIYTGPRIQITKIMGSACSDAKFALLNIFVYLR